MGAQGAREMGCCQPIDRRLTSCFPSTSRTGGPVTHPLPRRRPGMAHERRGPTTRLGYDAAHPCAVSQGGPSWRAVDPQQRRHGCSHGHRYQAEDMAVTVCLLCGLEVEPVSAEVLDLDTERRRRSRQRQR